MKRNTFYHSESIRIEGQTHSKELSILVKMVGNPLFPVELDSSQRLPLGSSTMIA